MSDQVENPEDRFSHNEAHIRFDFARNIDCVCSLDRVTTIHVLSKSNLSSENSHVLHSRRNNALHRRVNVLLHILFVLTCNFSVAFYLC